MGKQKSNFTLFLQEGEREFPKGAIYYIFTALSLAIFIFEMWLGTIGSLSPYHYCVIFITGILPIALITTRATKNKITRLGIICDYLFAFLVLISGVYLLSQIDRILNRISAIDPLDSIDVVVALILVVAVFELTRRTLGFGLTLLLIIGLIYVFYGHLISGAFGHRELSIQRFLDEMVFTANGIFGAPVQVAATYAFLFITFGHFFQKAGASRFIFDMAAALTGRRVGGLAKVAVTTAGAFGSVSGSPTSDVATTGSINIPMMKKYGYGPVFAGAVETAAASGGTILPPIMGSTVFLMAEFTNIPYFQIAIASVLTALLYYLGIYFQVHFRSLKLNLKGMDNASIPSLTKTIKAGFYYFIPVIILVWAMHAGTTPSRAATYAIIITFIISFVRRQTWISLRQFIDICNTIVYQIAPLTVATAAAGIIIGMINLTGLAGKFVSLIFSITNGNILFTLILAAVITIILGMGMPTPSVYILVAALVAPALIQLQLPVLQTHLFLVFFAALSAFTPPVGVAAYTAAGIANASPFAIGIQASKLAAVGFILPFMFIYSPELLLIGEWGSIVLAVCTALVGVYALALGVEGYLQGPLTWWERVLLIITGITIIFPGIIVSLISFTVIALILYRGKFMRKGDQKSQLLM